jgi:competence protein ComEA
VRLSSRSSDDADVIRARLRALLAESGRPGGWLPDEVDVGNDSWDEASEPGLSSWAGPRGRREPLADRPQLNAESDPDADSNPDADPDPGRGPAPEQELESGLPPGIGRHRAPGAAVRLDPGRRGARSLWAAGLVAALLVAGWTWLDRPHVQPVSSSVPPAAPTASSSSAPSPPVGETAETSSTVVVSVVGLVKRPGLVTLATGARVADAIRAAGGLLPHADAASVNLAAVVSDGEQIAVAVPGASGASSGTGGPAAAPPSSAARLNLNTATMADLDGLPGIGPVLAQRIIDYRDQQGRFTSVDQLDDVPGIGPSIAARLAKQVTV